ncbi:MAG: stage III sporulation protein SpoIIIAB [Bacillaceae bacterium]
MLKLIGMLAILLSTTWYGFYFSKKVSDRPKQLRMLKNGLQSLEAEIVFSQLPLSDACEKISLQFKEPLAQLFQKFATNLRMGLLNVNDAWKESVQAIKNKSALTEEDCQILLQFGETLGLHDRISQQKHILLTMNHLNRMETEAVERQQQYEKMAKMMGVLVGLLLVIILY